jgi:perosamine synthetase
VRLPRRFVAPFREAFGPDEVAAVNEVVNHYRVERADPPYNGIFQRRFEQDFSLKMGGGFSLAVCTGSVACYLAVMSLELPAGSEVIVSPVTDSGSLFAIIQAGLIPVIADSADPLTFNVDYTQIKRSVTEKTKAIFLVHSGGLPLPLDDMQRICALGFPVIEDCSQAPFATYRGSQVDTHASSYVGSMGVVAVFSTMYRKTVHTGGSGGIVHTRELSYFRRLVELADRGRPKWDPQYIPSDPGFANRVSLNFNTDEFSCAIGIASLRRVDVAIRQRREFLRALHSLVNREQNVVLNLPAPVGISPFYFPVVLAPELQEQKESFCDVLMEYGVPLAKTYPCIVADWLIVRKLNGAVRVAHCENVMQAKRNIFNLFLNERYSWSDAEVIAEIIGYAREKTLHGSFKD